MRPTTDSPALLNRFETVKNSIVVSLSPPDTTSARPWWTSTVAIVALVLLGCGLRTIALSGNRNLWLDEAMLALNLIERSPAQLMEPLDRNQGAPVGFLLLAKAVITQLGASEVALRLVPFVASALGLVGFAWVAPRLLPRPAAVFALLLMAVSPFMISYAAECKQYGVDAAITVGLFAVAAGLLQGGQGFSRWAALGAAGAAAVWFSHPSAFVLGGIGTALLAEAAVKKDRGRLLAACGTVAVWLVSFGACYFLTLKQLGHNQYLLDYWNGHFLPFPPKAPGDLVWVLDHYFAPFSYPAGLGGTEIRAGGIAAVLFVVGLWGMWKERWAVAAAVILPALFALLASAVHKYPFSGRLLLFLVPLMMLGIARGAWMVGSALRGAQPLAALALIGVLVAAPCLEAYQELQRPMRSEQLAPVLANVRRHWQPGDRMYVYYGAEPAFIYYTRNNPFPPEAVTFGVEARKRRLEYRNQLLPLRGTSRVWLVFSHPHKHEEADIRAYAEGLGRCLQVESFSGAAAYLFDFTSPSESGAIRTTSTTPQRDENRAAIVRGGDR